MLADGESGTAKIQSDMRAIYVFHLVSNASCIYMHTLSQSGIGSSFPACACFPCTRKVESSRMNCGYAFVPILLDFIMDAPAHRVQEVHTFIKCNCSRITLDSHESDYIPQCISFTAGRNCRDPSGCSARLCPSGVSLPFGGTCSTKIMRNRTPVQENGARADTTTRSARSSCATAVCGFGHEELRRVEG